MKIEINGIDIEGDLNVPNGSTGLVIFAHGSGSGRFSPRNRYVADMLNKSSLATLLIDLLTHEEEAKDICTRELRFNIPLLANRLIAITDWVMLQPTLQHLKIGYFGASTGAGAAIIAASQRTKQIYAIVSRGGRPDLAANYLKMVEAPTLLIVGERDNIVIDLNNEALEQLNSKSKLIIIPQATHLFEERGALEEVAKYAVDWFKQFLI